MTVRYLTLGAVVELWLANNDTWQIARCFGCPEATIANMMPRVLEAVATMRRRKAS